LAKKTLSEYKGQGDPLVAMKSIGKIQENGRRTIICISGFTSEGDDYELTWDQLIQHYQGTNTNVVGVGWKSKKKEQIDNLLLKAGLELGASYLTGESDELMR
jgi:hypothetical protein